MNNENNMSIAEALPKALFVWIKTLFYFIVLPYKIWKSSIIRLAISSDKPIIEEGEEFPMYTFNKVAMDAGIVILPILGLLIGLIAGIDAYRNGLGYFISALASSYFMIPFLSFLKEVITMSLTSINKLDLIVKNTSKD